MHTECQRRSTSGCAQNRTFWLSFGQNAALAHTASAILRYQRGKARANWLSMQKICSPDQVKDTSGGGATRSGNGGHRGAGGAFA
jgi:hypothetical protein